MIIALFLLGSCGLKIHLPKTEYFEGIIESKNTFINKTNVFDSLLISTLAGKGSRMYVKGGDFLAFSYGAKPKRMLYKNDENRIYSEEMFNDSLYWADGGWPAQKILNFYKTPKVEKILGIECDKLTVQYEYRTTRYYYNSDTLKVDPSLRSKYTYYNENFLNEQMKCIPIKTEIEYKDFVLIQTAVSIKSTKLSNDIFKVPKKILVQETYRD